MSQILQQIDFALDQGDTLAAARLAEGALAAGQTDGILYNLVAWLREEEGDYTAAETMVRTALERTPEDPTLHLGLGVVLRKQGRLKAASESFDRAIELDTGWASSWFERGQTFEHGGAIADATSDYRRAMGLEPNNPGFMGALAAVLARQGKVEEAGRLAQAALKLSPDSPAALRALSQIALEEKRFEDALPLLERGTWGVSEDAPARLALLGDAYEGLGRFDEAFAAYQRGKDQFCANNKIRMEEVGAEDLLTRLESSVGLFAAADKAPWLDAAAADVGPAARHVFLTGHPRSGTTLAENILASLPGAVAIEERPTLGGVRREFMNTADGPVTFAQQSEAELAAARADYWERATRAAEQPLDVPLFVDMDPFKGTRLPIIARLFPGAKYVLTLRDPRDVVWSCFHTNFAFNTGTANFTSLESTARHYAATWALITETIGALPLDRFELRYESIVQDFDTTTQALCAFLDMPWSEEVRKFDRTAQRRGVSTASATQVRQGLYDGSGGWRRYEAQLASVEPILRPWIDRFGYS